MARKTLLSLQLSIDKLTAEVVALRAENSKLKVQLGAKVADALDRYDDRNPPPIGETVANTKYPLVDGLGRSYRLQGRVRCYPSN